MERYELEEAIDRLIAGSGVDLEQVIETLELMLERYRDQFEEATAT